MKLSLRITKDQTELTPEQFSEAKKYAKEQIKKFLSTDKVDKKLVETYAMNAYKVSGTKLPKKIRWFKSPEAMCQYKASVWDSVRDSVWDSVRDSVRDSVGASVWDSVRDSVGASVWDSVGASVGASVWDSVGASVRAYYDADDWSFYGFFIKYFRKNDIVWLLKLSENVTGYAFYEKECWLVEHPKTLDRDNLGKLHSVKGKAIEWRDKTGYYFVHGVKFDKKLWLKVTNPKVTIKTILTIDNIEQRMAALKLVGVEKLLESKESTMIDESARGNKLYKIEGVFDQTAYFLSYECPSTGRVYVSGVDPELGENESADECMAWKFNISKNEYLSLEVES